MNAPEQKVSDDLVVSLAYVLKLDDGQEIDRSDQNSPLEFLQGHSNIIPGLEKELYGMKVGEEKKVSIEPALAYGEYQPGSDQELSRDLFPEDQELLLGMGFHLRDSQGEVHDVYITDIQQDHVVVDSNHPLAGETLHFYVKIADLREATEEELTHGHVHGPGHNH